MSTYNHMVHVRYSIFDPSCCECVHPGQTDCDHELSSTSAQTEGDRA